MEKCYPEYNTWLLWLLGTLFYEIDDYVKTSQNMLLLQNTDLQ